MRQVTLTGVSMELPDAHPSLELTEVDPPRRGLRIPIGTSEGIAIAYAWKHLRAPRPLTHDLFSDVLRKFSVSLELVEVTAVEGRTFFAQATLVSGANREVVPCRPSDAVALAVRQPLSVPILVDEEILERGVA